jgi:hypothetical protein
MYQLKNNPQSPLKVWMFVVLPVVGDLFIR